MVSYEELGVRKVINTCSTVTHLGGSISDPRVMDAMKEASQSFVIMMELMERAGEPQHMGLPPRLEQDRHGPVDAQRRGGEDLGVGAKRDAGGGTVNNNAVSIPAS